MRTELAVQSTFGCGVFTVLFGSRCTREVREVDSNSGGALSSKLSQIPAAAGLLG